MLLLRGVLLIPLLPAKDIPLPPARRVRVQPLLWLLRHSLVLLRVSRWLLLHQLLRLRLLGDLAAPPKPPSPSSLQIWDQLLRPLLLLYLLLRMPFVR